MVRVFLCDDAPGLRALLRAILEEHAGIAVVGEAASGRNLAPAVIASGADVVLLDLAMPDVDGLEATAALREASPEVKIVILSGFTRSHMAERAFKLGADRYIEKSAPLSAIVAAIRQVAAERAA